jgi:transposase
MSTTIGDDREASVPAFVPAVVEASRAELAPLPARLPKKRSRKQGCRTDGLARIIEVTIAGVTIRAGRGADTKTLTAVIAALKAAT